MECVPLYPGTPSPVPITASNSYILSIEIFFSYNTCTAAANKCGCGCDVVLDMYIVLVHCEVKFVIRFHRLRAPRSYLLCRWGMTVSFSLGLTMKILHLVWQTTPWRWCGGEAPAWGRSQTYSRGSSTITTAPPQGSALIPSALILQSRLVVAMVHHSTCSSDTELCSSDTELFSSDTELRSSDTELFSSDTELHSSVSELNSSVTELHSSDTELCSLVCDMYAVFGISLG